ncbi:MAG TPA: S8 family serine peptidase [Longimicrobium sp.]|nr:S8 family serine peptidase [Longimicrobium sp.]
MTAGTVRAGLELLERSGVEVLELLDVMGAARVRMTPQAAQELAGHPLVDYVEPRQYGTVAAQTTPAGIHMVEAPTFWSLQGTRGAGARIQIIDSGHQQGHEDLPAVPTANCAGVHGGCDDADVQGIFWHGTHVLGIVTARDNGIGVVGVAPGILPSDVFVYGACHGLSCPSDAMTAGIVAGTYVDVISISIILSVYDAGMANAVARVWSEGVVIVAAAGNYMSNNPEAYPAAYKDVIGVSGVLPDKSFAAKGNTVCPGPYPNSENYSNYGTHVDLAAPFQANSTVGVNAYRVMCGTSMAAPHVAGVAALVRARNPTWTNVQIVNHLFATAEDRGAPGKDIYYGYGIVRARAPVPCPNITGPSSITAASTYAWQANAACGVSAYTYQWQHRVQGAATWTNVGTGSAYSRSVAAGSAPFELRVTVTSAGSTGSDTHLVAVSLPAPDMAVAIAGPAELLPGETGTWQAGVTGASGTVTYQWQHRLASGTTWTAVGTGPSYSRTAGLSPFYLRVTATAAGGNATDDHYVAVQREPIDNCVSGCEPEE